jgi:hypothetical protein
VLVIVERCLKKFIYKSWPPVMQKDAWNIHRNFIPASHNGLTMAMLQSTHESVMHISTLMLLNLSTSLGLIGIAKCYVIDAAWQIQRHAEGTLSSPTCHLQCISLLLIEREL